MRSFDPSPLDERLAPLLADFPQCDARLHLSIELFDRFSLDLAIKILRELDVTPLLDTWRSSQELCRLRGFKPRFGYALAWVLRRLAEPGIVEANGQQFRLPGVLPQPELEELHHIGVEIDPANAASLAMMEHAAAIYPAVARGELRGEDAMFRLGEVELWCNYFHNDNPSYAINNWIAAKAATDMLAGGKTILEIGAGMGSASEALLAALQARSIRPERYMVTEPSAFFRRRAERSLNRKFVQVPLEFAALDMDRRWSEQGMEEGTFDAVFAVNVFHVAKDLLFSLREARRALAPGGSLIIGESMRVRLGQPMYPEIMFQILDGYSDVTLDPEFRPNPGFLTGQQWQSAMTRAGFASVEFVPDVIRIQTLCPNFFTGAIRAR